MNIKQLRLFYEIHSTGSLTEASNRICMTQPAASKLLKSLEEEVGSELFSRQGRNLDPTPDSRQLFEDVRSFLNRYDALEQNFALALNGQSGSVAIGGMVGAMTSVVPNRLANFLERRPNIRMRLNHDGCAQTRELVATGQFDIGLVDPDSRERSHRYESKYIKLECLVGINKRSEKTAQADLSIEDLVDENWITFGPEHSSFSRLKTAFLEHGRNFDSRIFVDSTHQALQLVDQGIGVTLVDSLTYYQNQRTPYYPNVAFMKLRPTLYEGLEVIWPNCRSLSNPAQIFLDELIADVSNQSRVATITS